MADREGAAALAGDDDYRAAFAGSVYGTEGYWFEPSGVY
jgi:hypothetical protein